MWLKIEGDVLVNLDLIDKVEHRHDREVSTLWTGGATNVPESHVAYLYFMGKLAQKPNIING